MKHVNTCDRVVMNAKSGRTVGATANKKNNRATANWWIARAHLINQSLFQPQLKNEFVQMNRLRVTLTIPHKWNFEFDFNDRPSSSNSAENLKKMGSTALFSKFPQSQMKCYLKQFLEVKGWKGVITRCYLRPDVPEQRNRWVTFGQDELVPLWTVQRISVDSFDDDIGGECVYGEYGIYSFQFGGSASYDRDDDVLVVTMPKQNIQKAWVPLDRAPRVIWQFYEVASQDGWQWCPCWIERSLFTTWNRISRKTRMVLTYSRLYIQTKFDSKSRSMHLI